MIISNFTWYMLVIALAITGVLLSANYGLVGLVVFIALSVFVCFICPPALGNTSERFPKGDNGFLWATGLSFLSVLVFGFLIWQFVSKEAVAGFIMEWSYLGIVTPDTKELALYILEPTSVKMSKKVAAEIDMSPHWCLSLASIRIVTYLFLPIVIATASLNHTRFTRWRAAWNKKNGGSAYEKKYGKGFSVFHPIFIITALLWLGDTMASSPHHWAGFDYRMLIISSMLILILGPLWVGVQRTILQWGYKNRENYV